MGCSPRSDLSRAEVHGKVLLNGQPVGEGSIIFMPVDGNKGPTAGGGIKDGRYSIAKAQGPIVGKNRIELHSARLTGRKIPTPWDASVLRDEVVDDFSSPRFNRQSELFRNIEAGSNNLDFELTSQ
jgi:hypothetical protein